MPLMAGSNQKLSLQIHNASEGTAMLSLGRNAAGRQAGLRLFSGRHKNRALST